MKPHIKKHLLRMFVGLGGYILGLVALNYLYNAHSPYRFLLVLLPVLPLLYIASAIIRGVTELDEMQSKIQIEAMAFSGLATAFTCFSYLFLRDSGAPEFHAEWAFYLANAYYWVGFFFSRRRYQ